MDSSPRWAADGKMLVFLSDRFADEDDVWAVYLDESLESYTRQEIEAFFDAQKKAAKKRKPIKAVTFEDDDDNEESDEDDENDGDEDGEDEIDELPELDLADAYLRLRRITSLRGNENNLEVTPAGDRIVFTGNYGGSSPFSVEWDGSDRKKLGGSAAVQHVSLTGDKVVYVRGGKAGSVFARRWEGFDDGDQPARDD